ncbi:uncharacterized protein LOC105923718 isoform X3 [Fundulus heteroclitus]|uniref:uncharacterized protein LOC105923718 isoform X3 n=1 Tax=Fundulus heteroclitus TaxID=8078 RepID=UPI00165C70A1|nr:uncharacterized protein LOC105923718 isoform X3 [Fundulus heteroclitus]
MSSVQHLREFIRERLTAAAEEIFSEVEKTIVRYEEELHGLRRMMAISWKPELKLSRTAMELQRQSSGLPISVEDTLSWKLHILTSRSHMSPWRRKLLPSNSSATRGEGPVITRRKQNLSGLRRNRWNQILL